jgi:hypothetical protein
MRTLRLGFLLAAAAMSQTTASFDGTVILGRPTNHSITASILAPHDLEIFLEYGVKSAAYTTKTAPSLLNNGRPVEVLLDRLQPNTRYYYRLRYRPRGSGDYAAGAENSFHTQRPPSATFTFGVQGDSHPERLDRMFQPDLYVRTMENVRRDHPDFYVTLGDDFNVDPLYNRGEMTPEAYARLYSNQRHFLGIIASSSPLFLVNGNHEQAAAYLLNGTPSSPPVLAGIARNLFFPNPAPDAFYTGDAEKVEFVGLPRDYYAWTWGDALFITLDPYWHSPVQVDAGIGGQGGGQGQGGRKGQAKGEAKSKGGRKGPGRGGDGNARDMWGITLGEAQYRWFQKTLRESKAKYKFVFTHHVLGTGRGAVELADFYEWGGKNRDGEWEFDRKRPGWELPIHQLMVKYGVTIFFQGHDHLFARQQKDGVVYQETPNPADNTYTAFNADAYRSGDILPNSGYLRVTVSTAGVKVDYIRAWLTQDETSGRKNGEVASSYTVPPKL